MPLQKIQDFLQWRVDATLAGNFDLLAPFYRYPLHIAFDTGAVEIADHAQMTRFLAEFRADWLRREVARVTVEVTKLVHGKNGRFRVWAISREYDATDALCGQSTYVQYCQNTAFGIRTEMFETIRYEPGKLPVTADSGI